MVEVDIGSLLESLAHVYFTASEGLSENKFCPQLVFKNEGISLIVLGNESRLVQVFENILNNARSFSPCDGTISFFLKQKQGFVCVYIEDEGPGIPVESLEKVFGSLFPELTSGGKLTELTERNGLICASLDYADAHAFGWKDQRGEILLNPPLRKRHQEWSSPFVEADTQGPVNKLSLAETWLRLGLIDDEGYPTQRGIVFSFFHQGEGLALAAAFSALPRS